MLEEIIARLEADLGQFIDTPPGQGGSNVGILLGDGVEVANYFSVDPATSRLWVVATAPDGDDGTVDGVSEFGALYALELDPNGGLYDVIELCRKTFSGGSASTPALRADGSRVYVADAADQLFAIDESCNEVWSLN